MSRTARAIIPEETAYSVEEVESFADKVYNDDDLFAPIASGSFQYYTLFVIPCSESSVAKFACGIGDTLISRTFMCALKEGRRIIIVPRETPKSTIMLENELKLARLGVVVMDANPGFYPKPQTVQEMVDFIVGRCMTRAGIEHNLFKPWGGA